ncbi:hypothetical protein [Ruicaihuangia caeni]|uniref:hypothetical protein n=1 Tax=Ruicaihuangia caeni TaxID=3042517 RepID=UPI00338FF356
MNAPTESHEPEPVSRDAQERAVPGSPTSDLVPSRDIKGPAVGDHGHRASFAALFAGMAIAVPGSAHLMLVWGTSAPLAGTALAASTLAGVAGAPLWGRMDDRAPGLGMRVAGFLAAGACAALAVIATAPAATASSPVEHVVPLLFASVLVVFGFSAGGVEPLLSARLQRARRLAGYSGIRAFGSIGWIAGLAMATIAFGMTAPAAAFAVAAACFAALALSGTAATTAARRATVPPGGRIVMFVIIGLPVPVSAFVLTLFSSTAAAELGLVLPSMPFVTLMALAVFEVPAFLIVHALRSRLMPIGAYAASLTALVAAWMLIIVSSEPLMRGAGIAVYALAVAFWASAQVTMVASLSSEAVAALRQATAASLAKALSATLGGPVIGALIDAAGAGAAAWSLGCAGLVSLAALAVVAATGSDGRLATHVQRNATQDLNRTTTDRPVTDEKGAR